MSIRIKGDDLTVKRFLGDVAQLKQYNNWSYEVNQGTSKYGYLDWREYLVDNKIDDFSNKDHRFLVSQFDPVAKYLVWELPRMALRDGFLFIKKGTRDEPLESLVPIYNNLCDGLNYLEWMELALQAERTDGYSLLYKEYKNAELDKLNTVPTNKTIVGLDVFTDRDINKVDEWDALGNPLVWEIKINKGSGSTNTTQNILIHNSRMILVRTKRIDRSYVGLPALKPVWGDLTMYRHLHCANIAYGVRHGNPFLDVTLSKESPSEDEITDAETQAKQIHSLAGLVHGNDMDVQFKGLGTQSVNFKDMEETCLWRCAIGSGVPTDLFKGVGAGRITGSETNAQSLQEHAMIIQDAVNKVTRKLMLELFPSVEPYDIKWHMTFRMSEDKQVAIEETKARTRKLELENKLLEKQIDGTYQQPNLLDAKVSFADSIDMIPLETLSKEILRRRKTDEKGIKKFCAEINIGTSTYYKLMGMNGDGPNGKENTQ